MRKGTKRPLAWHRECLDNAHAHLVRSRADLECMVRTLERREADHAREEAQYAQAVAEGLTEYDRETYGKPRSRRTVKTGQ